MRKQRANRGDFKLRPNGQLHRKPTELTPTSRQNGRTEPLRGPRRCGNQNYGRSKLRLNGQRQLTGSDPTHPDKGPDRHTELQRASGSIMSVPSQPN